MSKKDKISTNQLASGLKNSLESLQASLDDWAAVEDEINAGESKPIKDASQAENPRADNELMSKLLKQIETLGL